MSDWRMFMKINATIDWEIDAAFVTVLVRHTTKGDNNALKEGE